MTNSDSVVDLKQFPLRDVSFIESKVTITRQSDDVLLMDIAEPLGDFDTRIGDWIDKWSAECPDRAYIVEQTAEGEKILTYGEMKDQVLKIGEAFLGLSLGQENPIVIMADNSIQHALVMLAALYVGVPLSPVAPAYALQTNDYAKLNTTFDILTPGLVIVEDGERFSKAIDNAFDAALPVMSLGNPTDRAPLLQNMMGDGSNVDAVKAAAEAVTGDTIAKFLFTSGSSGAPKAVINTHRMLCVNSQQKRQICKSLGERPPVLVDWLPWNHTAGGNSDFNLVLHNGGTLYIDPGKPTKDLISKSVELLKRVSPTLYFNVPMGFDALIPYMEKDEQLRDNFFKDLEFIWYAAAAMQPATWEAIERLAIKALGKRLLIVTGLGMTETAPIALFGNKKASSPGVVGLPAPGLRMKLIDAGNGHYEARYKGPNLTPGYWRNPVATAEAFDDEGYFLSGDLVSFVDENEPGLGMRFEGRQSEDFKLTSGTRVAAGALRLKALEQMQSLVNDLVVVGDGQSDVRLMIFPDWDACRSAAGLDNQPELGEVELGQHPAVKSLFAEHIREFCRTGTGSSNRLVGAVLLTEPASESAGEITQKGTLNRRILERNRPDLIQVLFHDEADPRVITSSC